MANSNKDTMMITINENEILTYFLKFITSESFHSSLIFPPRDYAGDDMKGFGVLQRDYIMQRTLIFEETNKGTYAILIKYF